MFTHVSHDYILAMNTISMTIIDYMTNIKTIHFWRWIDGGFDIAYSPFPLQPEQWLHERLLKTDSWPELSTSNIFKRQVHTHTHTKRPMWFHKRFPMLISSTEIRLISVSHPYPESMCSFKPRNWGDEKHVRSYPVQSNQYHFLVHASTALCCHMILIYFHPTKNCNWFGLMQILWLKALRIHCNASSIMSFLILLALATLQRAILDIVAVVARHGITSLLNTNGSRTVSLLSTTRFVVSCHPTFFHLWTWVTLSDPMPFKSSETILSFKPCVKYFHVWAAWGSTQISEITWPIDASLHHVMAWI